MKFQARKNIPEPLDSDHFLSGFTGELARRRAWAELLADRLTGESSSLASAMDDFEFFGLHRHQDGWIFREYAPNAVSLVLAGDFSARQLDERFALKRLADGIWEGVFPAETFSHLMHYKLFVRYPGGEGWRIPAYARYVVQDEQSRLFSAVVWEPETPYKFRNAVPPAVAPVIYESHPGMAQEEAKLGSFDEFRRLNLPEIAAKGYNTVQLMAVMEHPYYGSFGYHVANFFAVSSRFGTPDEFKQLVDEAHGTGDHGYSTFPCGEK